MQEDLNKFLKPFGVKFNELREGNLDLTMTHYDPVAPCDLKAVLLCLATLWFLREHRCFSGVSLNVLVLERFRPGQFLQHITFAKWVVTVHLMGVEGIELPFTMCSLVWWYKSRRTLTSRPRPQVTCLCYQLGERQWTQLPDLQVPRAYHGCAAVQDTLFAVGRRDKRGRSEQMLREPGKSISSKGAFRAKARDETQGLIGLFPIEQRSQDHGTIPEAAVSSDELDVLVAGSEIYVYYQEICFCFRVVTEALLRVQPIATLRWFRGPRLPWPVRLGSLVSTGLGVLVHVGGLSLCPETLYVLGGLSTSIERAPLEVLAASTADSSDRSFYSACQVRGLTAGSLVLPLPDARPTQILTWSAGTYAGSRSRLGR
ncbi:hypothetical protein HPB49_023329 [Dermacentor silvarum]|uniref:Uncharacterized protein n=1 Tax=Dermacentor silvarum TaxID=543639 RepID=A0ACB8DL64_DERSI|nr:hypothetical protein HPB49_023329 [Dermacentor silvarum]